MFEFIVFIIILIVLCFTYKVTIDENDKNFQNIIQNFNLSYLGKSKLKASGQYRKKTIRLNIIYSESFLFPVPVMRKLFCNRFLKHFKKAVFDGKILYLEILNKQTITYNELIKKLYRHEWVVYIKKPFATSEAVVKYIATYSNRVAISNTRIKMIK